MGTLLFPLIEQHRVYINKHDFWLLSALQITFRGQ